MATKGYFALSEYTGKPITDAYGAVLWFKSVEDARKVVGDKSAVKVLVRAIVPRANKKGG